MIILDTNVVSALMTDTPDPVVFRWLDLQPKSSIWLTAITVFETRYGLNIMPSGQRRRQREVGLEQLIRIDLQNRVLSYDGDAAAEAAALMAQRRLLGRTVNLRDTMIAGIALSQNAALATRNTRHFNDIRVPVVDPWSSVTTRS